MGVTPVGGIRVGKDSWSPMCVPPPPPEKKGGAAGRPRSFLISGKAAGGGPRPLRHHQGEGQ